MRKLKFRIWDLKNNRWLETTYEFLMDMNGKLRLKENEKVKLMQWTGLKDTKGKEIYEGDIVMKYGINFQIVWNKLGANFYCKPKRLLDWKHRPDKEGFDELEYYEVVGNIFKNPELMRK